MWSNIKSATFTQNRFIDFSLFVKSIIMELRVVDGCILLGAYRIQKFRGNIRDLASALINQEQPVNQ